MKKVGGDDFVKEAGQASMRARVRLARTVTKYAARTLARNDPKAMRSVGLVPTGLGRAIISCAPDLVHWHWVGGEIVSLAEMASISVPSVWTCHDQWAFCGTEHYAADQRFVTGYRTGGLFDVDAFNFRRKKRAWADWHPTLICPSEWMAQQARASALMGRENIVTIPNTIDATVFTARPPDAARHHFGLPQDAMIILFGAENGGADPRKGFDMLAAALNKIPMSRKSQLLLATFGGQARTEGEMAGFRHIELGRQSTPENLATLYSAADVFVVPSRADNLPNTMIEAQACGLQCVAFAIGGMSDIISRPDHGLVVSPFDIAELADAIQDVVSRTPDRAAIQRDAETRFGSKVVAEKHRALYQDLLNGTACKA